MRFLLTNDDGIDAPGLTALAGACATLGSIRVVAPMGAYSGCSHRVTTEQPIRVETRAEARFAVDGTPADCVRVALHGDASAVDWVLAGINHGGNLGADVHYSGTVAAVREAVLHGKPGIAVSHYKKRELPFDWALAQRWLGPVLADLLGRPLPPGNFWNINLPHLAPDVSPPPVVFCAVDYHPLPLAFRQSEAGLHYSGDYHRRTHAPDSDIAACFAGNIAISRIALF